MLRFSIITPSFNQGPFIEATIQSVLAQTLQPEDLEYVICDGGSTDQTEKIVQPYRDRLRWVSEPDDGQADAVNKGIALTSYEIIGWLNSDDVYYPGALATVQGVFAAYPEVQVVYGAADHLDEEGRVFEEYPTEPWNYDRLRESCYICQPAVFFRRSWVQKLGLLNSTLRYCMDYELWLRWGQTIEFYYLPRKLAGSRLYLDTKTLSQRLQVRIEINKMLVQKFGTISEKWLFEYAHVKAEEAFGAFCKPLWHPVQRQMLPLMWLDHLLPTHPCQGPQDPLLIERSIRPFTACLVLDYAGADPKQKFVNRFLTHSLWAFWRWQRSMPSEIVGQLFMLWWTTNFLWFKRKIKNLFRNRP
ncbi:MAG: glycosyltransferase family 2 protein [Leptolyngbyaceae cyanobacterium bins.59]|nr:glycosyltransferase family 2 protein [Leptolyngbyaceae cyanobacterium bins.59]